MNEQTRTGEFATIRIALDHLEPKTTLAALSGQLDTYCYAQAADFIFENMPPDDDAIVLDLSGLEFSDSSGIKVVMKLIDRYAKKRVGIYGINKNIFKILEVTALTDQLVFIEEPVEFGSWTPTRKESAA